jgi:hypothetical protein
MVDRQGLAGANNVFSVFTRSDLCENCARQSVGAGECPPKRRSAISVGRATEPIGRLTGREYPEKKRC